MDIADQAQVYHEDSVERSLKNRQQTVAPFSGFCLSCGEPVHERRFCDAECRQDYEDDQKRRRH